MKRPSFQFYPAEWRSNANLRRCSEAARGAWMDILCTLHDCDQYGVARWPLAELAKAAGVAIRLAKELAEKLVLKGSDRGPIVFVHTPRHAGKDGEPVTLVDVPEGPCWFSSRMVTDEWRRKVSGGKTRFGTTPETTPDTKPVTTPRQGDDLGDGATTSSSTSPSVDTTSLRSVVEPPKVPKRSRRQLPEEFPLQADLEWAKTHWLKIGRVDLCNAMTEEIEKFRDHHRVKLTASADWPASWRTWARNAIKYNNGSHNGRREKPASSHENHNAGTVLYLEKLARESRGQGENSDPPDAPRQLLLAP